MEVNYIIKRKNEGEEEGKRDTQTRNTWRETKNGKYEPRLKETGEERRGYRRPN